MTRAGRTTPGVVVRTRRVGPGRPSVQCLASLEGCTLASPCPYGPPGRIHTCTTFSSPLVAADPRTGGSRRSWRWPPVRPSSPDRRSLSAAPTLNVDAVQDSVLATELPFGATLAQVTRPDAQTGSPVVIGQYGGFATPFLPFSVNTTTPTPFNPGGDCWQKGKLSLPGGVGLTPDIRPGDTVTVSGLSFEVPADAELKEGPSGPIEGCRPISAHGRNSVTAATGGSGADVGVTGVAQLSATEVSLSATDETGASTAPVAATLNADGTWNASIPSADLVSLADGKVTLDAVYAVPDVATGAGAHIEGAPLAIEKKTVAGEPSVVTPEAPAGAAPAPAAPSRPSIGRLTYVNTTSKIYRSLARKGRIRVALYVPAGAKVVRVRLSRSKTTKYLKYFTAAPAGTRQVLFLKGKSVTSLRRGLHTLTVMAGPSKTELGSPIKRSVRVN